MLEHFEKLSEVDKPAEGTGEVEAVEVTCTVDIFAVQMMLAAARRESRCEFHSLFSRALHRVRFICRDMCQFVCTFRTGINCDFTVTVKAEERNREIAILKAEIESLMAQGRCDEAEEKSAIVEAVSGAATPAQVPEIQQEDLSAIAARGRHGSWPRLDDVKMTPHYLTKIKGGTKRSTSSSPYRLKNDMTRERLFGKKPGRPRVHTPGYDGNSVGFVLSK